MKTEKQITDVDVFEHAHTLTKRHFDKIINITGLHQRVLKEETGRKIHDSFIDPFEL